MRSFDLKHRITDEKKFDILLRPVVTEKTTQQAAFNQYAFVVDVKANKGQIKKAIEKVFKVTVEQVNTVLQKGKTKRFKGRKSFRSDFKKAYVTLKSGQTIDMTSGN